MPRLAAIALWTALLGVMAMAPPQRADLVPWLVALLTGDWQGEEPLVVALFQLMGVWPMVLGLQLRPWWRASWPAAPFCIGSFALGAYALLPWFFRSRPEPGPDGSTGTRAAALALAVVAGALIAWALLSGSPRAFAAIFARDGFVFPMTFDFVVLWTASALDARQRDPEGWRICLLPVVGSALWLVRTDVIDG